jgi:release factor glutamine methyltransferase
MTASIKSLLADACARLGATSTTPRLDAELLLAHALGRPRPFLYAWPEWKPSGEARAQFGAAIERRRQSEPLAYIIGQREFWSLPLTVTRETLIPRPDTELLVESALRLIPPEAGWRVADIGTGCGAVALALARERPRTRIVATDTAPGALDVARQNARALAVDNIEFRHGSWFAPLDGLCFDIIASNPPYVACKDAHLDAPELAFEPRAALVAGETGLEALERIAHDARRALETGAMLLLEHGFDQHHALADILEKAGYEGSRCHRDAAGHERVTVARWAGWTERVA